MTTTTRFLCTLLFALPLICTAMSHKARENSADNLAAVALVASSAYVDLMPTTNTAPRTLQLSLTFRYTGPGRIVDLPIHIFYDDLPDEQYPNSVTKHQPDRPSQELSDNDSCDVQKKYLVPKLPGKTVKVSWIDPKSHITVNAIIELKKVY